MNMNDLKRVLLIDDNPNDRQLVERHLAQEFPGVQVVHVKDAAEFAAALAQGAFQVVITDYQLYSTNGLAVLQSCKECWPTCPVIMFTATATEEIAVEAMKRGLDDYVVKKPEHFVRLIPAIRRVLERRREQAALAQFQQQLRLQAAVLEMVANAVLITDPSGKIEWVNPAFTRLTGYTAAEAIGQTPRLMKSECHPAAFYKDLWDTILAGRVWQGELVNRRKDGSLYVEEQTITPLCDEAGQITHFIGIKQDVSARKEAEDALRASEERYRHLFDSAPDVIFTLDPAGQFTSLNLSFETILGWARTDWLGKTFAGLVHADDLAHTREAFKVTMAGGSPPPFEVRTRAQNGGYVPLEVTGNPQRANGRVVGALGIARDIRPRKQLEAQYLQAQKMEAFGQLAGGVAHDFNNMLTVINGFSEMLLSRLRPTDPSYNFIHEIHRSGERAATLTRQLLAFSRRQILTLAVLDVNKIVGEMDKMLRRVLGEDIKFGTRLTEGVWPVKGDAGQIEQVILNLAVNARDAMPNGGHLLVETHNVEVNEDQAHPDVRPGEYVRICVHDTGAGIAPAVIPHIFEPFYTTKEFGKGTGLGLATVFGIVTQSGGHLEVESDVGQGSTFKVFLPHLTEIPSVLKTPSQLGTIPGGTETVLVVEDEEDVRKMAVMALTERGYNVLTAANGPAALDLHRQHAGPIHLLVTDVVMPDMSGRELADQLLSQRPDLKILFMSGYTDDAVLRRGISQQEVAFLQKPFTPNTLALKVRQVLDQPMTD